MSEEQIRRDLVNECLFGPKEPVKYGPEEPGLIYHREDGPHGIMIAFDRLSKEEKKIFKRISMKDLHTIVLPYVSKEIGIGVDKLQYWQLSANMRKLMVYAYHNEKDDPANRKSNPRRKRIPPTCYQARLYNDNRVWLTKDTSGGVCY